MSTLRSLKSYAIFEDKAESQGDPGDDEDEADEVSKSSPKDKRPPIGLGLSYTINLNLPATSDQAVFNAIFKSLRDHLLSADE